MFRILDVLEATKRIGPLKLGVACIGMAVFFAVALSHLFWFWLTGAVPDGLTIVAGVASIMIATPMVHVFVVAVYRLDSLNQRLFITKTKLNFKNDELEKARHELARLNEKLETRVAERTTDLERALRVAEDANAAKAMFLANMSHELRTPLNGIIGYADMIVNRTALFPDIPPETLDDYAAAIRASGRHLNAMVNDLLDLSKLEFRQFDIRTEPLSAETLMKQVVGELNPTALSRNQRIDLSFPDGDASLRTDRRAAHQILANLLSNALKYSGDGETVEVSVHRKMDKLSFTITDSGIGMPSEAISEATKPFSRFSDAHIASGQSVGLGLSIASKLCTLLGAELSLMSVEGTGTTARVDFPRESAKPDTAPVLALAG